LYCVSLLLLLFFFFFFFFQAEDGIRDLTVTGVQTCALPISRKLAGVVPVREFSEGRYVVMVTRKGVIKKTELSEFQNIRSNGINAVNVDEGDELLDVILTDGTKRIFIATHDGLAIRFDESDVRPMGRAARGVRGVDLRKG